MINSAKSHSRRQALETLAGLGAFALVGAACGDDSTGAGGGDATTGSSTTTGGAGGEGGGAGGGGSSTEWATGGTSVMDGKDYGNPFEGGVGDTCTVFLSSTEGPCHAPSPTTKDVSEGLPGLPMRLELLIVDTDCNPIDSPTVEIWHCDTYGTYTGDIDGNNDDFCTGGDEKAAASSAYRGVQTGGADGRVTFDTNFPGWYGGRATHIHFRVTVNGQQSLVSQIFFDESLKVEIYDSQPSYEASSGQGYQPNQGDQVISESGLSLDEVVVSTERQSDGAMLAWKAITVAS